MTQSQSAAPATRWHVGTWPPLAWLETVIKLVALTVALFALGEAVNTGTFDLPAGARLAQLVIQVILALGLVAAIFDRILEREIIAMAFVLVNTVGHWGMVLALLSTDGVGLNLAIFAALMLAGDLVKLLFIAVHTDFTVRDTPRIVLYALTALYAAGYALLLVIDVLR